MKTELIDDEAALEELKDPWQRLADEARLPYCQPEWSLAWWRSAAPAGSALRAVAVYDGGELAGLAPFYTRPADRSRAYRLLASPICAQIAPLARPGAEAEVATALAEALAASEPRPGVVALTRQPSRTTWPALVADAWPGGAALRSAPDDQAPSIDLRGRSAGKWLSSIRSSNMRNQIQRGERALDKSDATVVLAEPEEMDAQIATFARLHLQRMGSEPSEAMLPGVEAMLVQAGRAMARDGRFRLWTVRVGDRTIGSSLFVAAGGRVSFWLGAFDIEWSRGSPGIVALAKAIVDAIERGDGDFDLGPGTQPYKLRLNDEVEDLVSFEIFPRGAGYARARARSVPAALRRLLSRRLPDWALAPYRRLRRR